ncbi:MAG: DegT/DnrJ/EryC1/StrS family aminotransferase [Arhodomonas sp.]|nr:DegT/DnrJ/EryC1/StrS family aminotransferase [Arhodomonas sp.]
MSDAPLPLVDVIADYPAIRDEVEAGLREVMESGRFVLGPNVAAFEEAVAARLGVAAAVGCASGTDALHLALRALGIGAGDEVITTAFTFRATAEAICHAGAEPVFADIDPGSLNLDPAAVESLIGSRTRAILAVHLFGRPAAMGALRGMADRHGLYLVEDCAQAFGARWEGREVGALGDAGCFSFYPTKNLAAFGDGGLITVADPAVAERLRALRGHGPEDGVGFDSRLDEMQAVVLRARLPRLDAANDARRRLAAAYGRELGGLRGLELPGEGTREHHVYHLYTVLSDHRDELRAALGDAGIGTGVYYQRPLHQDPAFAACRAGALPVTGAAGRRCLSLPMHSGLQGEDVRRVGAVIRDCLGG